MPFKNKIRNIWIILNGHFLMPFCLSVFFISLLISSLGLKVNFVNSLFVLYTGLVFGFIAFFLWFKKLDEKNRIKKLIVKFCSLLLLISLLLITISNLNFLTKFDLPLFKALNPIIILISIFSGFIVFYVNQDRIEREIDKEHNDELESEQKRYLRFPEKFPKINQVPILNFILRWFYKEGLMYSLILIFVLSIFVTIKVPYLSLSFTGVHNMKYSSYVEPAKHMLENGLLWNQFKYQADPITLLDGKFDTFGQYPFMEWGIFTINKIFPSYSLEFNTRIFMTLLGVILLLLIYQVLKQFLVKKQVLLVLFLLSINVIFQFFTYVTVLDPINLIFLFSSLIFLIGGLKEENPRKLYLSGILAGIGISVKYHALIFYFPIFVLFLFLYKKISEGKKISYLLIILPNFLLQTVLFRISFRYLPRDFILFFSIFIILILIQIYLYKKMNVISNFIEKIFKEKIKLFYSMAIFCSAIILYLIFTIDWIQGLFNDFITDKYLITNWNMYSTFFDRYKEWLTPFIYYISISLSLLLFLIKNKKIKLLMFSFLTSTFIYFVLTSKVLYFHQYYHHIIIMSFVLFFSFVYYLTRFYKNILSKILINLVMFLIISIISYQSVKQVDIMLSHKEPEIMTVSKYLNSNLKADQFFIYSTDVPTSITFYSGRFSLLEALTTNYNKKLVKLIRVDLGNNLFFGEVMRKYNIQLYVTKNSPESENNDFVYLFFPENEMGNDKILPERTTLILCRENNLCFGDTRFLSKTGFEIFNKKIKPHLSLTQKINEYYIYQFE
jgi:hypothetical protein